MSNYYKSDCCGVPATIKETSRPSCTFGYFCPKCNQECEVTAMLDEPGGVPKADESVKQYQEDIEAGVDVGSHETIKIATKKLREIY